MKLNKNLITLFLVSTLSLEAENSVEVKKRTETEASLVPLTDITSSLSRT
jgi:hypothetical protein